MKVNKYKYEVVVLFYAYVNEDSMISITKQIFEDLTDVSIMSLSHVGRYDVFVNKKSIKINMMCCYIECSANILSAIKQKIKEKEEVCNNMIIRKDNKLIKGKIDYKYPIEMKKYIFESMRIIPRELTCFSKREQRYLSKNIKRARILGLLGR